MLSTIIFLPRGINNHDLVNKHTIQLQLSVLVSDAYHFLKANKRRFQTTISCRSEPVLSPRSPRNMALKIWLTAVLLLASVIGFEGTFKIFLLANFNLYSKHYFQDYVIFSFLSICLHTGAPAVPEGKLLENQVSNMSVLSTEMLTATSFEYLSAHGSN